MIRKNRKRMLGIILSLIMAFTVFPVLGEASHAMTGTGGVSTPYDVTGDITLSKSTQNGTVSLSGCTGSFNNYTYVKWTNNSQYTVNVSVDRNGYYQLGGYSIPGYQSMNQYSSGNKYSVESNKTIWFGIDRNTVTSGKMSFSIVTFTCPDCEAVFYDSLSAEPHDASKHTLSEPYRHYGSDVYHEATCNTCKARGHKATCYLQMDPHNMNSVGECTKCTYDDGTGLVTPAVTITSAVKTSSATPKKATVKFEVNDKGAYKHWPSGYKIYIDGAYKKAVKYSGTTEVDVPYSGDHTVYIIPYYKDASTGAVTNGPKSNTKTIAFKKLGQAKISQITKLSSGKVCIHVKKPEGASGIKIYKGTKLIKTMTKNGSFRYSASGAGNKYYKTKAYIKENGKTYYSSYSKAKKPLTNSRTWSGQGNYSAKDSFRYATANFRISKIYYSKGRLKVSGYLYNTRIFDLKKVKIKVRVNAEGKTYSKTFTKTVNMGEYGKKKITLSFPKSSQYDLRAASLYNNCVGNWGFGYEY